MYQGGRCLLLLSSTTFIQKSKSQDSEHMVDVRQSIAAHSCCAKCAECLKVCLAALLAHVGGFVPAKSLTLSPCDAIFVRMGARDSIVSGQVSQFLPARDAFLLISLFYKVNMSTAEDP